MIETVFLIVVCAYIFDIADPLGSATFLRRKLLGQKHKNLLEEKDRQIKELENEKNELEIRLYKRDQLKE